MKMMRNVIHGVKTAHPRAEYEGTLSRLDNLR
jgi:hypothetical protein